MSNRASIRPLSFSTYGPQGSFVEFWVNINPTVACRKWMYLPNPKDRSAFHRGSSVPLPPTMVPKHHQDRSHPKSNRHLELFRAFHMPIIGVTALPVGDSPCKR